jgi:hypothetical protein
MFWTLILALQAAAPAAPVPEDFDLARLRPIEFALPGRRGAGDCVASDPSSILVCGRRRRDGDYPYEAWARAFEPRPIVAETALPGNVMAAIHGESAGVDRGAIAHRVMLRIRVPF